jgi:hypothetical protein
VWNLEIGKSVGSVFWLSQQSLLPARISGSLIGSSEPPAFVQAIQWNSNQRKW